MIRVTDLFKSFGETQVLRSLSFTVETGEKVFLSAPSGAGKTTLLRILCGLESSDGGTVEGCDPNEIAFQFQEPRLFPSLTALQNVTCIAPDPAAAEDAARDLLSRLGLADALDKRPDELSGGMKQRVALARTLFADRPVVLLDEPFAALDPELKDSVRRLVAETCAEKTVILVSHDPADACLTQRTMTL